MNVVPKIRAAIERIGWSETARRTGLSRMTLHRCFGDSGRNGPTLKTIERVLPHVGLELAVHEVAP